MVRSADQNALMFPQNVEQPVVQPQISTLEMPVKNDAVLGMFYQQFACFQLIDGTYHFAGMIAQPVGQAYAECPPANYFQDSNSIFGQNNSNQGANDPSLADPALILSAMPSQPFIVGSEAHKVYLRFQDDYKKAEDALKIYEQKLLLSPERERANWEKLAKRKRDQMERVKGEIDVLVQKEKHMKLQALFEAIQEEETVLPVAPQSMPSFAHASNLTELSSILGSEDVDRRLAELREKIFQAQKTFKTYKSKSTSGKRSAQDRAKFSCRAERKREEVEKMQKEMQSLGATVIPPKKKHKK